MMYYEVYKGATNVSIPMMVRDKADLQPIDPTIDDMNANYWLVGANAPVAVGALAALATITTAHTDGLALAVDSTGMLGLVRVDWPDAAFAVAGEVVLALEGTMNGTPDIESYVEMVHVWVKELRDGLTQEETERVLLSHASGPRSGGGSSAVVFDSEDGSLPRISLQNVDGLGNSASVIVDGSPQPGDAI